MKEVLIKEYNNTVQLNIPYKKSANTFNFHFLNGAFLEILGSDSKNYIAKFFDKVILLDQPIDEWTHPVLFSATYKLFNELSDNGIQTEYQNTDIISSIKFFTNLLETNKAFCIYPFMHLIEMDGQTTVCTRSVTPITKAKDIKDWQTDPNYTAIREKMLRGEKIPEHCSYCYTVEKDGGKGAGGGR